MRLGPQAVFRSVNRLLLDTATSEYLFCCDFFSDDGAFMDLFQPTLQTVEAALAVQLQVSWCAASFLCAWNVIRSLQPGRSGLTVHISHAHDVRLCAGGL